MREQLTLLTALLCLTSATLGEGPPRMRRERPEPAGRGRGQEYSIKQAVSGNAQLHTIAFSGLAFLTGDFGAATFLPPGKVCDFFGFQYMRDIDAAGKGHNPMFLNRVAGNVLHVLSDEQKQRFLDLAEEQAPQLGKLARMRLSLIQAFHLARDGCAPAGSAGLNREAVVRYVADLFAYDAQLSLRRAEVMAQVARSLTPEQKAYLARMRFGDFDTWPALDERGKLKRPGRGRSRLFSVAYMTYASEFFSWTAGTIEADTYFCPERHATYFGGFYMKDMPAMGKRDFDISTSVTGDSGREFLNVLTAEQRRHVTAIPDAQRKALSEIVEVRRAIAAELRRLLDGEAANRDKVLALGRRYGELDGEISYACAAAFAEVNRTLTDEQRKALLKLRGLEGYKSAPYYVYSRPAGDDPALENVEAMFRKPEGDGE